MTTVLLLLGLLLAVLSLWHGFGEWLDGRGSVDFFGRAALVILWAYFLVPK